MYSATVNPFIKSNTRSKDLSTLSKRDWRCSERATTREVGEVTVREVGDVGEMIVMVWEVAGEMREVVVVVGEVVGFVGEMVRLVGKLRAVRVGFGEVMLVMRMKMVIYGEQVSRSASP